jgi:hypothetical protein
MARRTIIHKRGERPHCKKQLRSTKVDELICMIKGNETQGKAITDANAEEVDFIACNYPYPAWMNKSYHSNFQKPYPRRSPKHLQQR